MRGITEDKLRLFWGDGQTPGIQWDVRSIRGDGSFHGEICHYLNETDKEKLGRSKGDNLSGFATTGITLLDPLPT